MSFELNTRARTNRALRQQPDIRMPGGAGESFPAEVIAENGDGFDVQTVDAGGRAGRLFPRCYPYPSDASVTVGQEVWLWVPDDGESPLIQVNGGGSGGCYGSILFGALV